MAGYYDQTLAAERLKRVCNLATPRIRQYIFRWFEMQAAAGLLGAIDYEKTGNGKIVCKDGFTGTALTPGEFLTVSSRIGADTEIAEVDGSSLFCEMTAGPARLAEPDW